MSRLKESEKGELSASGHLSALVEFSHRLKNMGWRSTLSWVTSKEAPVIFQVAKYGVSGVFATAVQIGIFTLMSHTVLPAHDYLVEGMIDDSLKERNSILSNLIAFPFSNLAAYLANIYLVFTRGRHHGMVEFLLFTLISLLSYTAGLAAGPFLISRGLNPWIAQATFVVTSASVNFVLRKFVVFLK